MDRGTRRLPRRALTASWLVALPIVFLGYGLAGWLRGWAIGADSSVYRAGAVPYWRFPAAWSTPLLAVGMLCLVPVWRTIGLGQVNVVLMAMVAVDVLAVSVRGSRWGGLLTGVAAAVKLVPLIFIPHLLLTGRRTAAARALAVFAGLQGLALVIAARDSAYWTSYVIQTGRIGPAQQPYDQSLDGLTRIEGQGSGAARPRWVRFGLPGGLPGDFHLRITSGPSADRFVPNSRAGSDTKMAGRAR